jgi:two-component system sensor histidine kinase BaeS
MRRRIFWSMVAVAVGTLLVGGVTAAYLIGRSVEDSRRDEFLRQAAATGQLIESQLDQGPGPGRGGERDNSQLFLLLEASRIIGGHDFVEASVEGPRGAGLVGPNAPLISQLPDQAFETEGTYSVEVEGEEVLALVRHVERGSRARLVVAIGSTQDLVPWNDVIGRLLLGLAVGVALAAILATWLARGTGKRLGDLANAAGAIAGGDLGARAPVQGSDEVTEVAAAFNEMAIQIESGRQRERDFLMSVGHDLRTPLTTIRGYSEALATDEIDAEDLPRVAAVLEGQSDRLARLVEDIMLLSRLEAREFTLRPEPVDLSAHLKEVADAYRDPADEARVALRLDFDATGLVEVDPDRMGQIAGNLVENALRYTPQGGTVELHLRQVDELVEFAVVDTGPGIAAEDLPYVFDRLYVASHYRPVRPEGSGLGLNIVKELTEAMGGTVIVESALGRGTTVTVTLEPSTNE